MTNYELKLQIAELKDEFKKLENKMASLAESRDFLSGEYDSMRIEKVDKASLQKGLHQLSCRLKEISTKVYQLDETLEFVIKYSYQYNIKLIGVPRGQTESLNHAIKLWKSV